MITLDLFNSKFNQELLEQTDPQRPEPEASADPRTAPDQATRTQASIVFQQMQKAFKIQQPILTIDYPGNSQITLTRNQMFSVLREIIGKPTQVQNRWVPILGNRTEFLNKLGTMKFYKAPVIRMQSTPGQQRLDLDEKKSSKTNPYKDVEVSRAMRVAQADNPAAASDTEAFAKSMLRAQDKDQNDIAQLRQSTQKQRELLSKNISQDKDQQSSIQDIRQEIDKVDRENDALQKMQASMASANARLQDTLSKMRRPIKAQTPKQEPGVSVATDKIAPEEPSTEVSPIDIGARQQAQAIAQELQKLKGQQQQASGTDVTNIQQQINNLTQQLSNLQQSAKQKPVKQTGKKPPESAEKLDEPKIIKIGNQPDTQSSASTSPFGDYDSDLTDLFSQFGVKNLKTASGSGKPKTFKSKKVKAEDLTHGLEESGPETWTVHFTDGTTTKVRVPSDETDPAKVRAFFAKKGKTVNKFDYGFGTEPEAGPGPERHEPGSGSAVSARTGDALPEADTFNRGGHNPLRDPADYTDKRAHLFDLLSHPGMAPEDKQFIRQRLLDLDTAARKQGFVK